MLDKRVIPILLIESKRLVKSINFNKLTYVGDPINAVKIFNDKYVDEIIILDITNNNNDSPDFELIQSIANECFIPLTYGGNIKSFEHAVRLFKIGIEKISLNTMIYENPKLVKELVKNFGSSSIIASIDYSFIDNSYYAYNNKINIEKITLNKIFTTAKSLGVGEILLNNIDRDGCMNGPDLYNIKKFISDNSIPIIYCGGVGSFLDIYTALKTGLPAIAVGSYFVFYGKFRAVLITYLNKDEILKINEV